MTGRRVALSLALLLRLGAATPAHADERVVSETIRVTPGPNDAYRWPYYLYIPAQAADAGHAGRTLALLVEPNNTGSTSDDVAVHDRAARDLCGGWNRTLAERLGAPLLVPAFPRPAARWQLYTHALDRDTLLADDPPLRRLDRQLLAMIADARTRLRARHLDTQGRVLLDGYSASGMFVSRFVVLHPEAVLAAAVGSPGGWPIVPVAEHGGRRLRYPIGVADLADVAGARFDATAWRRVPLFYYLGDRDSNDSVPSEDSFDAADRALVDALFGDTPVKRWPQAAAIYRAAGCACELKLYPGADHRPSQQMRDDVSSFFRRVLDGKRAAE